MTANMNLINKIFFWYRYRVVIVCSVTGALYSGFYCKLQTYEEKRKLTQIFTNEEEEEIMKEKRFLISLKFFL